MYSEFVRHLIKNGNIVGQYFSCVLSSMKPVTDIVGRSIVIFTGLGMNIKQFKLIRRVSMKFVVE